VAPFASEGENGDEEGEEDGFMLCEVLVLELVVGSKFGGCYDVYDCVVALLVLLGCGSELQGTGVLDVPECTWGFEPQQPPTSVVAHSRCRKTVIEAC
jgi:hypothetical protein